MISVYFDLTSLLFQIVIFLLYLPISVFLLVKIRRMKSISNVTLLKVKRLTILSFLVIPLSIGTSIFKVNVSPILLPLMAYIINSIDKSGIEKFDIIMVVLSSLIYIADIVWGINIFYVFMAIYVIIYVVIYNYSREEAGENKKLMLFISSFILASILLSEIGLLLNLTPLAEVSSVFMMFLVFFIQIYSILEYTISTDEINNKITTSFVESSKLLSKLRGNTKKLLNDAEILLNGVIEETSKFSNVEINESIKNILNSISGIDASILFIQNSLSTNMEKVETISKDLPIGIDNFKNSFSVFLNEKQLLSDVNSNVMNLTKIALDSEKSVMEVSRAVKNLRTSVKNFVEKLSLFETISEQSEILSINISVEASKVGKESAGFSKLSRQAKRFSEIISAQISDIKDVMDKVDKSSENSEYVIKTLVMSFVEIESGLKNVSKDISSFLSIVQQVYASSQDLLKVLGEIGNTSLYLPSFMEEMKKRFQDIEWDYKKVKVHAEEFSKTYNIFKMSLENIRNSIKNLSQLIEQNKEIV